jgi:hypothetical protein
MPGEIDSSSYDVKYSTGNYGSQWWDQRCDINCDKLYDVPLIIDDNNINLDRPIPLNTIKEIYLKNSGRCKKINNGAHITIILNNDMCYKIYSDDLNEIYSKLEKLDKQSTTSNNQKYGIYGNSSVGANMGGGKKTNIKYNHNTVQFGGKKISYKNIQKIETSKNNIKIFLKNKAFQIGGNQSDLKKLKKISGL